MIPSSGGAASDPTHQLLQLVFDYFEAHGQWPYSRVMALAFESRGDYWEVAKSIGWPLISTGDRISQNNAVSELNVAAIRMCAGSDALLADFLRVVRFCGGQYRQDPIAPFVTGEEMVAALELSPRRCAQLFLLISREGSIFKGGSHGPEPSTFRMELHPEVAKLSNIQTIDEYLVLQRRAQGHTEASRRAFHDWVLWVRSDANQRLVQAVQLAVVSGSSSVAGFGGWLLALSGATVGLIIANSDAFKKSTDPTTFNVGLVWLLASCAAGTVGKLLSFYVTSSVAITREIEKAFTEVADQYEKDIEGMETAVANEVGSSDLDLREVTRTLLSPLVRPCQWIFTRTIMRGWDDPGSAMRSVFRLLQWQGLCGALQGLFAALALGFFATSLF